MADDESKKDLKDPGEQGTAEDRPAASKGDDLRRRLVPHDLVAQLGRSDHLGEQLRSLAAAGDRFSAATKLAQQMSGLTGAAQAAEKLARISWPESVTGSLIRNLRPWSAMAETLRIDTGQFGAAAKLAKEMQGASLLGESIARFSGVETGLATELRRLQQSMLVFRPDPRLDRIARDFAVSFAPYQSQFEALSKAIEAASVALRPNAEVFRRAAEEERVAEFILELGFVPHGELWDHIAEIERPEGSDLSEFSEKLVSEIWGELSKRLVLDVDDCMGDGKLHAVYAQMLEAHDAGLHEMTMNSLPTVLERAVSIARGQGEKLRTFEWIETEVAQLPISWVGGYRGYRVWKVLIDHTFAGCWTDAEADATKYPNRHASAHGKGTRVANVIDSLNAILLTHFVITMAKAVRDYRESDAA